MASHPNGALYTSRARDLAARVLHHELGRSNHTARHEIDRLVRFELLDDFETGLRWKRSIERWRRSWKTALISERTPDWRDLMPDGDT